MDFMSKDYLVILLIVFLLKTCVFSACLEIRDPKHFTPLSSHPSVDVEKVIIIIVNLSLSLSLIWILTNFHKRQVMLDKIN
jgi:hypothetical protein